MDRRIFGFPRQSSAGVRTVAGSERVATVLRLALLLACLPSVTSCVESSGPRPEAGLDSAAVTPDVFSSLDSRGFFVDYSPPLEPFLQIDVTRAAAIADAYVKTFGEAASGSWSAVHGAPVKGASLRRCGRAHFATDAYSVVDAGASALLKNSTAGRFIFLFCSTSGVQQLQIGVAQSAVDVIVSGTGLVVAGTLPDGALSLQAVPRASNGIWMYGPERAVELAYRLTGTRVSEVPFLELSPLPDGVGQARWRIKLERPVTLFGTRTLSLVLTDELLVGLDEPGGELTVRLLRATSVVEPGFESDSLLDFEPGSGNLVWRAVQLRIGHVREVEFAIKTNE